MAVMWRVEILIGGKRPWWKTVLQDGEVACRRVYMQRTARRHRLFRLLDDDKSAVLASNAGVTSTKGK